MKDLYGRYGYFDVSYEMTCSNEGLETLSMVMSKFVTRSVEFSPLLNSIRYFGFSEQFGKRKEGELAEAYNAVIKKQDGEVFFVGFEKIEDGG